MMLLRETLAWIERWSGATMRRKVNTGQMFAGDRGGRSVNGSRGGSGGSGSRSGSSNCCRSGNKCGSSNNNGGRDGRGSGRTGDP